VPNFVIGIEIVGLFNKFDISHSFSPGINIIFGKNGRYKTTLLHIIANALNEDYERFIKLQFNCIKIHLDGGITISLRWDLANEKLVVSRSDKRRRIIKEIPKDYSKLSDKFEKFSYSPILPTAYFPAFRTMIEAWIEAWASGENDKNNYQLIPNHEDEINHRKQATIFARKLFGDFIPQINYLSLLEIERSLIREIQEATLTTAQVDRKVLSQSFVEIFAALSLKSNPVVEKPENLLKEIEQLSQRIQNYPLQEDSMLVAGIDRKLRDMLNSIQFDDIDSQQTAVQVLSVYRNLLGEIVNAQEKAFSQIERYLDSVNKFLEDKKVEVNIQNFEPYSPSINLILDDGDSLNGLQALSSGERQIITLIYAAHRSSQKVILIDEPEISLHVDWQEQLIPEMSKQLQNRQIITCTHSPMIGANYEDSLMEMNIAPTDEDTWSFEDFKEDDYSKDDKAIVDDEDLIDN